MIYSKSILRSIYYTLLQIRLCEESLIAPISNGEVKCPVHLCTGQEAVAAGVCAALSPTDYVFGNHRSHGHFLAHGGTIKELIAEVYCKETGCSRGRGGSMHLCKPATGMLGSAPIVAGTISLALGSALASAICQDKKVTVSFFGDGATGEGVLYESFNFAALKKLPIIFACENNLYSTHMSIRECRANGTIYKSGLPFSVPSFRVDGNDVLAVFAVAKKAALACRSGKGPVFIEFMTYRFRGHVGADDNVQGVHTDIRPKKEIAGWFKKDPIRRFERYLLNGVFGKAELLKIKEQVDAEINDAFNFALKSPCPQESDLGKYVFKK